jgi:carboxymethylenebutenolidase
MGENDPMTRHDLKVPSREGSSFDCYLALPDGGGKVPAVVLTSAVFGVDDDIRRIADELATRGFIAAAPNLFWRDGTGPLPMGHERASKRAEPRLEKIAAGEADLADVLASLRKQPLFNGRAAVMGFCYGGPYAILGPKRLGYDAGISCHGTQLLDYVGELEGLGKPVCLLWGDQDVKAPPEVLDAYRAAAARMNNLELHVFPGILHGYTMRANAKAFDQRAYDFSMARALAILDTLL